MTIDTDTDLAHRAPLMVAYGMGVDSTAMLVGLHARGIRPDAILFADTGSEKPETYAYLPVIQAWLKSVDFPPVTVVKRVPPRAPYTTLEGNCLANETLPSMAFGMGGCSVSWKKDPQDKWTKSWKPAVDAWARGQKVTKAIGYDSSPADLKRARKMTKPRYDKKTGKLIVEKQYDYWHPLQDWGWTRDECKAVITGAGLPLPMKSACWFCPSSKRDEVEWLRDNHPELFARAIAMEEKARNGKYGLKTIAGLGRKWSWTECECDEFECAA
jgi:hypothetical protein